MAVAEVGWMSGGGIKHMTLVNTYNGGATTYTVTDGNIIFLSVSYHNGDSTANITVSTSSGVTPIIENSNTASNNNRGSVYQGIYSVHSGDTITVSTGAVVIVEVSYAGTFTASDSEILTPTTTSKEQKVITGTFNNTWCVTLYGCTGNTLYNATVENDGFMGDFTYVSGTAESGISVGIASEITTTVYAITNNTSYPRCAGGIVGYFS